MANRRMGMGMGGGRAYNNYSQQVNPWQDGAAPGGNQGYNSGGMSQLVDTTQIALALTNLLRPQQSQSVPSLLSLPPIAPVRNSGNHYGSNSGGSYRSNYMRGNKMNIRNSRGMDFNKRQNISNRKPQQRKPNTKNNAAKSKINKKSETSKTKKTSETSSKLTGAKSDAETNDCNRSEDVQSEEQEGGKRDWKEEKNKTDLNESKNGTDVGISETADGKSDKKTADNNDESNDTENSENEAGENDSKSDTNDNTEDKYVGIPTSMLQCLICQKRMWDVESFEKHIRGKAHQEMLDSYEESCRIKADMMRESMRLAEEKNWIEVNRLKRLGKRVNMNMESHCNMCNLDFIGKLNAHRKSQGHQKLKYFIHPRCSECQKEFQTRIEFEHHKLSPSHMKTRLENWNKKKKDSDDTIPIESEEIDLGPDMPDEEDEENEETPHKHVILDMSGDIKLVDLEHRLPQYSKKLQYGASFLEPISGFKCKLCNLFLTTEVNSQNHLSSAKHYNAFVDFLIKEKNKTKQNEKRSLTDENDEEENSKRRKISSEETDETAEDNKVDNSGKDDMGKEIYDPIQADNDYSESENETGLSNLNNKVEKDENINENDTKKTVTEDVEMNNDNSNGIATDEIKKETTTSPRTRARSQRNTAQRGKPRGGKAQ